MKPRHRVSINRPTHTHQAYVWYCLTCPTVGPGQFTSKKLARVDSFRHSHPDVTPPEHTPKFWQDEMDHYQWICSCGKESWARGTVSERRQRQSFTAHYNRATIQFFDTYDARAAELEDQLQQAARRWQHDLTPKGRAFYTLKGVKDLLGDDLPDDLLTELTAEYEKFL